MFRTFPPLIRYILGIDTSTACIVLSRTVVISWTVITQLTCDMEDAQRQRPYVPARTLDTEFPVCTLAAVHYPKANTPHS